MNELGEGSECLLYTGFPLSCPVVTIRCHTLSPFHSGLSGCHPVSLDTPKNTPMTGLMTRHDTTPGHAVTG